MYLSNFSGAGSGETAINSYKRRFSKFLMLMVTFLIIAILKTVVGQTGTDARNLRTQLFDTDLYDKKVRSASDQSSATDVFVSFYLANLIDVDESREMIRTSGYLFIEWRDDYLTWNPASYGGIEYSYWPQDEIWKPDVALKNSFKDYKKLGDSALNVQVHFDGSVVWSPFQVFETTCSIDVTYFPFDIQTCKIVFVAWSYTKTDVYMREGTRGINMEQFETNSEWNILRTSATVEEEKAEASVIFTLVMKRKPRHFLMTVFLPILMLIVV